MHSRLVSGTNRRLTWEDMDGFAEFLDFVYDHVGSGEILQLVG